MFVKLSLLKIYKFSTYTVNKYKQSNILQITVNLVVFVFLIRIINYLKNVFITKNCNILSSFLHRNKDKKFGTIFLYD